MTTGTLILLMAIAAAVLGILSGRIWDVFGPADLGPVDFSSLVRRTSPNDALAAPAGLGSAKVDVVPPVFAVDVARLKAAVAEAVAAEPRTVRVDTDGSDATTERYVQRSALMGYPDTIVVRYIELPGNRSTLALYSRSKLGYSDLGANGARIVRWLDRVAAKVPAGG